MLELIDGRDRESPVHIARPRPVGARPPDEVVRSIVDDVRLRGDDALREYSERFDRVRIDTLRVPPDAIAAARRLVPPELIEALEFLAERVRQTSLRQASRGWLEETPEGLVGELVRPLRRVGVYVPGGRAAYPSTVIMGVVPAQVAGVEGIAVCSPPQASGDVAEAVLAACSVVGVDEIYRVGGAHAIGALAYGTETVRPVEKIVGPGNVYVTLAKRLVQGWVGIDSEAGPTELAIVADESADPDLVAADLIAQAEHGPNGSHVVITWSPELVEAVAAALERQVVLHERADDVENALIEGGRAVLVRDVKHALETANAFAPEHLQLFFAGAREHLDDVRNAGAVFVGRASSVPLGDYVVGSNHILPSGGTARWASGLGVHDFTKRIYAVAVDEAALDGVVGNVDALAEAEGLHGHARAVRARLQQR